MSRLKISEDLFLEVQELNRLVDFLANSKGSGKGIIKSLIYSSGILKEKDDSSFLNFKIESGTNSKTIKVGNSYALDNDLNLIYKEAEDNIIVPENGSWYWVKIAAKSTPVEVGLVSVDSDGNLTGINTEFLKVLRGKPNFPVKIRFYNSSANFNEYEVLEVVNNTTAKISGTFTTESTLKYSVIGHFTRGKSVLPENKEIYSYDSCIKFALGQSLILETVSNQAPAKSINEYWVARVKVSNNTILIEDKRTEFFKLKSEYDISYLNRGLINNLLGVEEVKWDLVNSVKTDNEVSVGWGMRSKNWSLEASLRKITISSGNGGLFKDTTYFTDGDFDGFRLYAKNGSYQKIIESWKSGNQINLVTEVLNPSDYIIGDELTIVPDVEEIQIKVISDQADKYIQTEQEFNFPIKSGIGKFFVKNPVITPATYNITLKYRYKVFNQYTEWFSFIDDVVGYYDESSFKTNGELNSAEVDRNQKPYADSTIEIVPHVNSYGSLLVRLDKGDLFDVNRISNFNFTVFDLIVGTSKYYQYLFGNMDLNSDIIFNVSSASPSREGNRFVIHLDLASFALNGKSIKIVQDYIDAGSFILLKEISIGDLFTMKNMTHGIRFDLIFDGANWIINQNYNIERHYEVSWFDGDVNSMFDNTTKLGKVQGWFGYALCNVEQTLYDVPIPDLSGRFIVHTGNLGNDTYAMNNVGGASQTTLALDNIPYHEHSIKGRVRDANSTGSGSPALYVDPNHGGPNSAPSEGAGGNILNQQTVPFNNNPAFYTLAAAKKLF